MKLLFQLCVCQDVKCIDVGPGQRLKDCSQFYLVVKLLELQGIPMFDLTRFIKLLSQVLFFLTFILTHRTQMFYC